MTDKLKFDVGDRVRFLGRTGEIREIRTDGDSPSFWVDFDDVVVEPGCWFPAEMIERERAPSC